MKKDANIQVNWEKVRCAIERSLVGHGTEDDHVVCQDAWMSDRGKYAQLHSELKRQAHARINPLLKTS